MCRQRCQKQALAGARQDANAVIGHSQERPNKQGLSQEPKKKHVSLPNPVEKFTADCRHPLRAAA